MLCLSRNPILNPRLSAAEIERQLKSLPHPISDRRLTTRQSRRRFRDARKEQSAVEAIGELPGPDEALHLVISGRFALWHMVPAIHQLSGRRIDELRIATLGFSRENVDALCAMLDAGRIRKAWLLCSHFFKGTSEQLWKHAFEQFARRPDRARFASLRTHAKLVLLKLADGRTFTIESSANLRSCKNIEQITIINSPPLYAFHSEWMNELFNQAEAQAHAKTAAAIATQAKTRRSHNRGEP